jgi:hypothetical protein
MAAKVRRQRSKRHTLLLLFFLRNECLPRRPNPGDLYYHLTILRPCEVQRLRRLRAERTDRIAMGKYPLSQISGANALGTKGSLTLAVFARGRLSARAGTRMKS